MKAKSAVASLRYAERVVDVAFEPGKLPSIGDAVTCHLDDDRSLTAIVHAHLAEGATRTVAVASTRGLRLGNEVRHAGGPLSIPVGDMLLGRVVDLEGRPLDGGPPFPTDAPRLPIQRSGPRAGRRSQSRELYPTGIKVIDLFCPLTRGARAGVFGGAGVGKTLILTEFIHNAIESMRGVAVFLGIGERSREGLELWKEMRRRGVLSRTSLVFGQMKDPPGTRYFTGSAGLTLAEYFRDVEGRDVLLVIDNLYRHVQAGMELSSLLGRMPSRGGYPGDIFHIHAELLERAAALRDGRSITAIPIVETTENDIAAYIPTNLISIADGQIYLDTARFERDERPAIDVGRSVSRIGGAAQPRAIRTASRNLRILLSRLASLEALSRVGLELEESTRTALARGRILRELLRQPPLSPRSIGRQLVELTAAWEGWLDGLSPREAAAVVRRSLDRVRRDSPELLDGFDATTIPAAEWVSEIEHLVRASRPAEAR